MAKKVHKPLFEPPELRVIGALGHLMVNIDGYADKEEKETIKRFLKVFWHKNFGDFNDFIINVEKVADSVKAVASERRHKVDRILKVLSFKLDEQQKDIVFNFLTEVIESDSIYTEEEESFMDYIKRALSLHH